MINTDTMLIFDLDGTLWDSAVNVADSWNEILRKEAPELATLDAEFIHTVMGMTMSEIADATTRESLSEAEKKRIFKICEEYEVEYVAEHGGLLFPGVRKTLKRFLDEGYKMAVVSNCQTGYVGAFIKSMKMEEFFCDTEEWGRTLKSKAENIKLVMKRNGFEKAIYIGDTQKDMDAAIGAGIPFIHAAYGFGKTNPPDGKIESFSELYDCIKNMKL